MPYRAMLSSSQNRTLPASLEVFQTVDDPIVVQKVRYGIELLYRSPGQRCSNLGLTPKELPFPPLTLKPRFILLGSTSCWYLILQPP